MTPHTCHARGCTTPCRREYLMCAYHWRMLPRPLRVEVYRQYRAGQCDDKDVTPEYLEVAREAIEYVAAEEQRRIEASRRPAS